MPTEVVTCFLRNRGDVLLLRRSEDASVLPGRWMGVTGYVEGDPDESAERVIRRETGSNPELVRRGEPLEVVDDELDEDWIVHPYLYDAPTRRLDVTESGEVEWVPPPSIMRRRTDPELWRAYRRVAPSVESVRDDSTHGSAYISLRALEVLRDSAAAGDAERVARELLEARPTMTALVNRVNRVMHESEGTEEVEELAQEEIERAGERDGAAARNAAELLDGTVLTLSRSGTVMQALFLAEPEVVVAESRPLREGVGVAEELRTQMEVTLVTDAAAATFMRDVDAVLVGADSVQPDGGVVNKTGTRAIAVAAQYEGVPLYVAASTDKISAEHRVGIEEGPPTEIYSGDSPIDVQNPLFDVTPPDLIEGIATEEGLLEPGEVAGIAGRHRGLREW